DPTALAVVERVSVAVGGIDRVTYEQPREVRLHVRHLERVRLGTPYMEAAERVSEVMRWPGVAGECTRIADATGGGGGVSGAERVSEVMRWPGVAGQCTLIADATGVGGAVMEMLRPEGLGCPVVPVTITSGDRATQSHGAWRVPKRELVAALMVSLQTGQLRI